MHFNDTHYLYFLRFLNARCLLCAWLAALSTSSMKGFLSCRFKFTQASKTHAAAVSRDALD